MTEIELYPFDFDTFASFDAIEAAAEVSSVASILADFGVRVSRPWAEPMASRGMDAVNQRFTEWGSATGPTILYWVGHGWSTSQNSALAHAKSPKTVREQGVTPGAMAAAIADWEAKAPEGTWLLVIVEACKSGPFITKLAGEIDNGAGPRRIALLAAADRSAANLGELRRGLDLVLRQTFARDNVIRVSDLVDEVTDAINSKRRVLDLDRSAVLERIVTIPEAVPAPVEETAVDPLLGRGSEREALLDRLDQTGYVVVSGPPGGGKSALLREVAMTGADVDGGFSVAGLNVAETVRLVGEYAGGPELPTANVQVGDVVRSMSPARKKRLVVDGVDRATDPPAVAKVLRELGSSPHLDLAVGSRPELFDELGVAPAEVIEVERDPDLIRDYVLGRLQPLVATGTLSAEQVASVAEDVVGEQEEILYARLVVEEILARPGLAREGDVVHELGHTSAAVFGKAVARLRNNNRAVRPMLTALALSRGGGLPIRDGVWAAVASAIAKRTVSVAAVHQFVSDASPYLTSALRDHQTVYRLAQRTYVDYLARDRVRMQGHHLRIARRGEAEIERADGKPVNPYWAQHLEDHWVAAQGWF